MSQTASGAAIQYGTPVSTTGQQAPATSVPACSWYQQPDPNNGTCRFSIAYVLGAPGRLATTFLPADTNLQVVEITGLVASALFWGGLLWMMKRSLK